MDTEKANPATAGIDRMTPLEIVTVMNAEDAKVAAAVRTQLQPIASAIEAIAARLRRSGRLIYVGAGTSGRLGALDAAECPPTFNTPPEMVVSLIAGGAPALTASVEELEDSADTGRDDAEDLRMREADVMVGIAASGRTPYVLGAMAHAREMGALTIGLACNPKTPMEKLSKIMITPVVGPEVINGSTRLKAGTAQKMVLNMLSTGAMILLGKTFDNLMVDLRPTNSKLRRRAVQIVQSATGLDLASSESLLRASRNDVKTAIVAGRTGLEPEAARVRLIEHGGVVWAALTPDGSD